MSEITVPKLNSYNAVVAPPPDVAASVCAVLACAYAVGVSSVFNLPQHNSDVAAAIDCAQKLGATIKIEGDTATVTGAPFVPCNLFCGSSITTARLLIGLLCGLNGVFTIDGDDSIKSVSLSDIIKPLKAMGAKIEDSGGCLPVKIIGAPLSGIEYFLPSSAKLKGALLLAGLNCAQSVVITEKAKTDDSAESLLSGLNGEVTVDGNTVVKCRNSVLFGNDITIPGDINGAVYHIIAALIVGGKCTVNGVGKSAITDILSSIGAQVTFDAPCKQVTVAGRASELRPMVVEKAIAINSVDCIPALMALACHIKGVSVFEGAGELTLSDGARVGAVIPALKSLGADIELRGDDVFVYGGKKLCCGQIDGNGEFSAVMAAAVAALKCGACIKNSELFNSSVLQEIIGAYDGDN